MRRDICMKDEALEQDAGPRASSSRIVAREDVGLSLVNLQCAYMVWLGRGNEGAGWQDAE